MRNWKNGILIFLAAFAATGAVAKGYIATAGAQAVPEMEASPMLGWSGYYGAEAGGKLGWLISNPGFVPVINDSVYVEASAFLSESGHLFLAPLMLWEFHLHPEWSVYAEAGAEFGIHLGKKSKDAAIGLRGNGTDSGLIGMAGALYRFKPDMALRAETEFATQTVRFGLSFAM